MGQVIRIDFVSKKRILEGEVYIELAKARYDLTMNQTMVSPQFPLDYNISYNLEEGDEIW